jgi:hypothetical protein
LVLASYGQIAIGAEVCLSFIWYHNSTGLKDSLVDEICLH